MADVDSIRIESDERGFEMHLTVCEEPTVDEQGRMILNVHAVATDLVREVKKIAEWEAEGLAAAAEYTRERGSGRLTDSGYENPRYYDRPGSAFTIDDEEGYDLSDPKHPRHHEVFADLATKENR